MLASVLRSLLTSSSSHSQLTLTLTPGASRFENINTANQEYLPLPDLPASGTSPYLVAYLYLVRDADTESYNIILQTATNQTKPNQTTTTTTQTQNTFTNAFQTKQTRGCGRQYMASLSPDRTDMTTARSSPSSQAVVSPPSAGEGGSNGVGVGGGSGGGGGREERERPRLTDLEKKANHIASGTFLSSLSFLS